MVGVAEEIEAGDTAKSAVSAWDAQSQHHIKSGVGHTSAIPTFRSSK